MSESSQMQPGWYYAQGDDPGTQRYWDGTQWVGGPQPVGQVQDGGSYGGVSAGVPAEWVQRVIAYLIDIGMMIGAIIVLAILTWIASAISEGLGTFLNAIGNLAIFGFVIWNWIIRQGQTGQSIGKQQQNIKLVSDETGQPLGAGMAFVRYLVAQLISFFTCGIGGLLDVLWPLWDDEKKRLTDKVLKNSVVNS